MNKINLDIKVCLDMFTGIQMCLEVSNQTSLEMSETLQGNT